MGSGVGLWALNLQALAKNRPVYAIDLMGFGRSSRINFPKDAVLAEAVFVESIESWRREMGLNEHFALLGHSMGGYIAAAYALRYAQNIKHLILADPWGFMEAPSNEEWRGNHPVWLRAIATLLQPFNPLTGVRAAGPWGKFNNNNNNNNDKVYTPLSEKCSQSRVLFISQCHIIHIVQY